ncbi:indole-3-glycerol phosphate synthase, partial [Coprococcus eutactus]|nr:indole-3-glycerol phosphate synthase [Coprococcus eutactus]
LRKLIPDTEPATHMATEVPVPSVPQQIGYVSESGIKTKQDIDRLKANGTDAVLIGEPFMRSPDKKKLFV